MKTKIMGILIVTLLIATAVLPVSGIMNVDETDMSKVHKVVKNNEKIILASLYASGALSIDGQIEGSYVDCMNAGSMLLPPGWLSHDFGGMDTAISMWHEENPFSTIFPPLPLPPNSLPVLFCGHDPSGLYPGFYDAGHYDNIAVDFSYFGIYLGDYLNIPANCPSLDMTGKMNYIIHDDDVIVPVVYVDTCPDPTWIRLASAKRSGSTLPNAWVDFSFEDWIDPYLSLHGPHMINVLDFIAGFFKPGGSLCDVLGIGFALKGDMDDTVGLTPPSGYTGAWSGMLLDDVALELPYTVSGAVGGKCVFIAWGDPGSRTSGSIPPFSFPHFYDFDYGTSGFLSSSGTPLCIDPAFHNHLRFDRTEGKIHITGGLSFGFNILIGSEMLSLVFLPLIGTPSSIDITGASYKLLYN